MTIDEFKKWAKDNPTEFQELVQASLTVDLIQEFTSTNKAGRSWLDSQKDQHHQKALETWKANNLDKIVTAEINKKHPPENPLQAELAAIKAEWEKEKTARAREALKNQALTIATAKKLPIELIDHFVGTDETTTAANLAALEKVWTDGLAAAAKEKFKEHGRTPHIGGQDNSKNPWSTEHFNLTEQGRISRENPDLARQLKSQAK